MLVPTRMIRIFIYYDDGQYVGWTNDLLSEGKVKHKEYQRKLESYVEGLSMITAGDYKSEWRSAGAQMSSTLAEP